MTDVELLVGAWVMLGEDQQRFLAIVRTLATTPCTHAAR